MALGLGLVVQEDPHRCCKKLKPDIVERRRKHDRLLDSQHIDGTEAALRGSSYLRLPSILQWFTGNIGFHHIHHLNPRIPNYRLEDCHGTIGGMEAAPILTLRTAISTLRYALWDENLRRMVRFP